MKPSTYLTLSALLLFVYGRLATEHFGNHLTPQSDAECICDGIVALGVVVGMSACAIVSAIKQK